MMVKANLQMNGLLNKKDAYNILSIEDN